MARNALVVMSDVTQLLAELNESPDSSTDRLLAAVYDELRRLAASKMAAEKPGHTLQATALVHEAYLRLVGEDQRVKWQSRKHFFGAAAEAMRRILIERARRVGTEKRGGGMIRVEVDPLLLPADVRPEKLLALDEALERLKSHNADAAELVKLRYFAGLSHQDAADAMGMTRRQADGIWTLARAWLYRELQ
jgi:RNA polymerase sigma factor (TIGR02999 family)